MSKVSACFPRFHVCDFIQFRDDHARMYQMLTDASGVFEILPARLIVLSLCPTRSLGSWSYLKAIFGNIRTHVWKKKLSFVFSRKTSLCHRVFLRQGLHFDFARCHAPVEERLQDHVFLTTLLVQALFN